MNSGLLWFDNDKKTTLKAKIIRAAEYYHEKYGQVPTLCMVNPNAIEKNLDLGKLAVRPWRSILPGHLWIGVDDK